MIVPPPAMMRTNDTKDQHNDYMIVVRLRLKRKSWAGVGRGSSATVSFGWT